MKIHLILIIILATFCVNYVETISCYVCNSNKDQNCDHLSESSEHLKDCSEIGEQRYEELLKALDDKLGPNQSQSGTGPKAQCTFCDKYASGQRFQQCIKTILWITDDSGTEERVIRDCTGLICKESDSCYKGQYSGSGGPKSEVCYCGTDRCNSSHRRVHQSSVWTNILLSVLISINLMLNLL